MKKKPEALKNSVEQKSLEATCLWVNCEYPNEDAEPSLYVQGYLIMFIKEDDLRGAKLFGHILSNYVDMEGIVTKEPDDPVAHANTLISNDMSSAQSETPNPDTAQALRTSNRRKNKQDAKKK